VTVPTTAYQAVFNFSLSALTVPQEIAQTSFWATPNTPPSDWDALLLDQAEAAYLAWAHQFITSRYSTAVQLENVTAKHYNADFTTAHEQTYSPSSKWKGTDSGASLPWETTLCISPYSYTPGTFIPHGRRRRGRMYLPPMAASQLDGSNTGFFVNSEIAAFGDEVRAFGNACAQDKLELNKVVTPGVFSRLDGRLWTWTDIAFDAKFDSQRRREHRQLAGREYVAVDVLA
jgi:hypothetical protein